MRHLRHYLQASQLFGGYGHVQLARLLQGLRYRITEFRGGQVIAQEHAPCSHMGIVLVGKVEIQKTFASGKVVSVSQVQAGEVFGEAMVFSQKGEYPATIVAAQTPTHVMFISHEQVRVLCSSDDAFFPRFASLLSNKLLLLNKKVQLLSYPSVRQKVIAYLLDLYDEDEGTQIRLPVNRQMMAQELGMPRPSLSREMMRLREEGFIEFHHNVVDVKDAVGLREELLL